MQAQNDSNLPAKRDTAFSMRKGVQLRSMPELFQFAECVVASGLAPASFKTPAQVLIAIQYGAEIGLSPMQALQSIAVINGRPGLYGDAIPALVHGSGRCEYIREWQEGTGDASVFWCEAKRKDQAEPVKRRFSVQDARLAGLWGKIGPWKQYPGRMLSIRARSFALRDAFADVLRGFNVVEELQDTQALDARQAFDPSRVARADEDNLLDVASTTEPIVLTGEPTPEELAEMQPELFEANR